MTLIESTAVARARKARLFNPPGGRDSSELEIVPDLLAKRYRIKAEQELRDMADRWIQAQRISLRIPCVQLTPFMPSAIIVTYRIQATPVIKLGEHLPLIEDVMRVVCARFSITRRALLSQRRTLEVVRPRQIAMYLAKVVTLRSFPEIGRRFGGRDHTTVIHAVDKIANMMLTDRELAEEISILRGMLEGE
jgi:hypothetical protein